MRSLYRSRYNSWISSVDENINTNVYRASQWSTWMCLSHDSLLVAVVLQQLIFSKSLVASTFCCFFSLSEQYTRTHPSCRVTVQQPVSLCSGPHEHEHLWWESTSGNRHQGIWQRLLSVWCSSAHSRLEESSAVWFVVAVGPWGPPHLNEWASKPPFRNCVTVHIIVHAAVKISQ